MDHYPEEFPDQVGKPDPPLTPKGHLQARATAFFLRQYLQQYHSGIEVSLESSPFLRTMQTLDKIGRELRISACKLNYRAQEVLFPEAYKSNPIPQLVSQTTPLSEMSE